MPDNSTVVGIPGRVVRIRPEGGTLELRRVEVTRYGERTVTVSQGIRDGERVVLQGVQTVSAGEHVRAIAPLYPEDAAS